MNPADETMDLAFIKKRIVEQRVYISQLRARFHFGDISRERFKELYESANTIKHQFEERKRNYLKKLPK